MRQIRLPLSTVLACLLCFAVIGAESTTGTITGIILDANGNLAKDCIVVAQPSAEKMREGFAATTNEKGVFTIENVPAGEYNLKARTRDLKSKAAKSVTVTAGKTADVGKIKLKQVMK